MFAYRLAFNPRSKATNIGYLFSSGAVFGCRSKIKLRVFLIFDSQISVFWLPDQISEKICGRRQAKQAAWETKFQRIDIKINKKNYVFSVYYSNNSNVSPSKFRSNEVYNLLEHPQITPKINRNFNSSQRQLPKRADTLYLWPWSED